MPAELERWSKPSRARPLSKVTTGIFEFQLNFDLHLHDSIFGTGHATTRALTREYQVLLLSLSYPSHQTPPSYMCLAITTSKRTIYRTERPIAKPSCSTRMLHARRAGLHKRVAPCLILHIRMDLLSLGRSASNSTDVHTREITCGADGEVVPAYWRTARACTHAAQRGSLSCLKHSSTENVLPAANLSLTTTCDSQIRRMDVVRCSIGGPADRHSSI